MNYDDDTNKDDEFGGKDLSDSDILDGMGDGDDEDSDEFGGGDTAEGESSGGWE